MFSTADMVDSIDGHLREVESVTCNLTFGSGIISVSPRTKAGFMSITIDSTDCSRS